MTNNINSYFIEHAGLNKHNSFPHLIQSISPNLEMKLIHISIQNSIVMQNSSICLTKHTTKLL